jgi:hypothetical protein
MSDRARPLDEWQGLKIGDDVRVTGSAYFQRSDLFVILELHAVDALGPDREEAVAVIRDPEGGLHEVNARRLERH